MKIHNLDKYMAVFSLALLSFMANQFNLGSLLPVRIIFLLLPARHYLTGKSWRIVESIIIQSGILFCLAYILFIFLELRPKESLNEVLILQNSAKPASSPSRATTFHEKCDSKCHPELRMDLYRREFMV